jgi:hypothetical protein
VLEEVTFRAKVLSYLGLASKLVLGLFGAGEAVTAVEAVAAVGTMSDVSKPIGNLLAV